MDVAGSGVKNYKAQVTLQAARFHRPFENAACPLMIAREQTRRLMQVNNIRRFLIDSSKGREKINQTSCDADWHGRMYFLDE
jgi:hypothetical protein